MMRNLVVCKHYVPDNTSYWCSWASPVSHTFELAHSLWTLAKWVGLQFIRTSPHACLPIFTCHQASLLTQRHETLWTHWRLHTHNPWGLEELMSHEAKLWSREMEMADKFFTMFTQWTIPRSSHQPFIWPLGRWFHWDHVTITWYTNGPLLPRV